MKESDDCASDQIKVEAHLDSNSQSIEYENLDNDTSWRHYFSTVKIVRHLKISTYPRDEWIKTYCNFDDGKAIKIQLILEMHLMAPRDNWIKKARSHHDDLVYEDIVYDQKMVIYKEIWCCKGRRSKIPLNVKCQGK